MVTLQPEACTPDVITLNEWGAKRKSRSLHCSRTDSAGRQLLNCCHANVMWRCHDLSAELERTKYCHTSSIAFSLFAWWFFFFFFWQSTHCRRRKKPSKSGDTKKVNKGEEESKEKKKRREKESKTTTKSVKECRIYYTVHMRKKKKRKK